MKALQLTVPTKLIGALGDVWWDLPATLTYVAGQQIHCTIYVGNTTDQDHTYMLRVTTAAAGVVVSEGTIRVNNKAWFTLGSWEYAELPGSLMAEDSNVVLTLELIEESTLQVADSVSVNLVQPSATELGIWGGAAPTQPTESTTSMINAMVPLMLLVMIMSLIIPKKKEKS